MRPDAAAQSAAGPDIVRPLLRHSPDVIFRLSRDDIFQEHIPTQGRRVGPFADAIVGMAVEDALPPEEAERTTECLRRALRSGEAQSLDYVVWEGEDRHVLEGRLVATSDRDALLLLLDATERRALVAASEAIVEISHALQAARPLAVIAQDVAAILALRLAYPAARVSFRHPMLRGAMLDAEYGDPDIYAGALFQAAGAARELRRAAPRVGCAAAVPIVRGGQILGTISVADDRVRRLLPATQSALESTAASLVNVRDRDRAEVVLAEKSRALRAYEEAGRLLTASLDLDEVLDGLAREIVETGAFRSLMVALVDERAQTVDVARSLVRERDGVVRARDAVGSAYKLDDPNITAEVARTGRMEVIRGWDDRYDRRFSSPEDYPSGAVAYFIPVKKGDRVLAVLATGSTADEQHETLRRIEDMETLLSQVAVALDHAQLYRQTLQAREEMRAIMAGARCLLWHATVATWEIDVEPWRHFEWDIRMFDTEAAQRFMPLDVPHGETYEVAWFGAKHPNDLRPMHDLATAAMLDGTPGYSQEFRCIDALGATRWLSEDVRIESVGPNRWRLVGVCTEITARKEVDQMKEEFISTVSHELRTPLTSILGALELVVAGSAGDLPEKSLPLLTIARDNGRRLTRLVNDILDIDKLESGRVAFDMQTLELAPLVEAAIEANTPFAEGLDVALVAEYPLPSVQVDVDVGRFAQLMANLISNAVTFSPSGDTVTVSVEERDGWARVSVADNGPGIPESAQEDLFDRFTQVDGSTTRRHQGTGLGLAIAKAIVERLRGRIGLTTEVGVGSAFFFDLRARARRAPEGRETTVVIHAGEDGVGAALTDAFAADGRVVELIPNADAAIRRVDAASRPVFMLDASAPAPGPLAVLRRLRADPRLPSVPVVATASGGDAGELHAGGFILLDCIPRPIDGGRLVAITTETARRRAAAAPLILHVGADAGLAVVSGRALGRFSGVAHAPDVRRARDLLGQHEVHIVLIDMALPSEDLTEALDAVGATPVVLLDTDASDGALPPLRKHAGGLDRLVSLVDSVVAWED